MTYTGKDKVIHIVLWIIVALLLCALAAYFLYQFGVFDSREEETTEVSGTLTDEPTGTPAGTTAEGPGAHTDPAQSSTGEGSSSKAAQSTTKVIVTTKPEQNIDDVTTVAATSTGGQGTSAPVDRSSAEPEGTSTPEHTTSPETPTSPQNVTTRTPVTTRDPYVTTRSPEVTTIPVLTSFTPDPAQTIIPPTTMPNGRPMTNGDRIDAVLTAPDGTVMEGYWEMRMEGAVFVLKELPKLAEHETCRGWLWHSGYHIFVSGTYEGIGMGYCDFIPDVILPPITGQAYTQDTGVYSVEPGSWW